jgi:hypothetical protein
MDPLYPYSEQPQCPNCLAIKGLAEKWRMPHCTGRLKVGEGQGILCRFGTDPHRHVLCLFCEYEFATTGRQGTQGYVQPLTAEETLTLREWLAASLEQKPETP